MMTLSESVRESAEFDRFYSSIKKQCGDSAHAQIAYVPHYAKVKKFLGAGEEGSVALLSDGRVLKVYYREIPVRVHRIAMLNERDIVPSAFSRIYEYGDTWIIREYAEPGTKKCRETYSDIMKHRHTEWTDDFEEQVSKLHLDGDIDLKRDCLGETPDGRVVLIDW